ncbi:HAD family hydrolase [bacterium]|nr:HAD family hydrolase [bacterium]
MIKNLLFDLDGTIINSKECIFSVYTSLFAELNLPLPEEKEFIRFIGPPVEEMLKNYIDGDVKKYCDRFRELYKKVDLFATNFPYENIRETLEELKKNFNLYVATTKNEPLAKKIIQGFDLDKYFLGVYGSLSNIGRVSKADVINAAVEINGLKKEECLLIGDTIFDVEGAILAGIKVGIVKYGFGIEKDFVGKNIEFFAESPQNIPDKIKECVL